MKKLALCQASLVIGSLKDLSVFVQIIDSVLNGQDFFGSFIRDFTTEFFFESHNQFNGVQAVCAQIVNEAGGIGYF